jgi:hypothetical protein
MQLKGIVTTHESIILDEKSHSVLQNLGKQAVEMK